MPEAKSRASTSADLEAPARRVQRGAGADHPGPDHQHVELFVGQPAQRFRTLLRAESNSNRRHTFLSPKHCPVWTIRPRPRKGSGP